MEEGMNATSSHVEPCVSHSEPSESLAVTAARLAKDRALPPLEEYERKIVPRNAAAITTLAPEEKTAQAVGA